MRFLITGATGFIGRAWLSRWQPEENRSPFLSGMPPGHASWPRSGDASLKATWSLVLVCPKPERRRLRAAPGGVVKAFTPSDYVSVNVAGTRNLCAAAAAMPQSPRGTGEESPTLAR